MSNSGIMRKSLLTPTKDSVLEKIEGLMTSNTKSINKLEKTK